VQARPRAHPHRPLPNKELAAVPITLPTDRRPLTSAPVCFGPGGRILVCCPSCRGETPAGKAFCADCGHPAAAAALRRPMVAGRRPDSFEEQESRWRLPTGLRHGHSAVDLRVHANVVERTGGDRHRDRAALATAAGRPAVVTALPGGDGPDNQPYHQKRRYDVIRPSPGHHLVELQTDGPDRSIPACTGRAAQPTVVPPSKPFGMAEPFFSAVNSSVAWVLFHSTESPAFV